MAGTSAASATTRNSPVLALEHHADAVANDPMIVRDDHVDRSIQPWCAQPPSSAYGSGLDRRTLSRPLGAGQADEPPRRRSSHVGAPMAGRSPGRLAIEMLRTPRSCSLDEDTVGTTGDRHLWDYTIGTICSTDKSPARAHHVGYAARSSYPQRASPPHTVPRPRRSPHDRPEHRDDLVAALTAAGFAALSALGRIELRNDLETDRASREPEGIALTDTWPGDAGSVAAMSPDSSLSPPEAAPDSPAPGAAPAARVLRPSQRPRFTHTARATARARTRGPPAIARRSTGPDPRAARRSGSPAGARRCSPSSAGTLVGEHRLRGGRRRSARSLEHAAGQPDGVHHRRSRRRRRRSR